MNKSQTRSNCGVAANNHSQSQPAGSLREPERGQLAVTGATGHAEELPLESAPLDTYTGHVTHTSHEHGAPAPAPDSAPAPEESDTALNAAIRQVIENLLHDDVFVNQLAQTI